MRLTKLAAAGAAVLALAGAGMACPARLAAQDPEPPPPAEQAADSAAEADSVPASFYPIFPEPASDRPGLALSWELLDLLATGALSFADLLEFSPLLDPLRAGFLEGPQASIFAGSGGGGLRYSLDGYEVVPFGAGTLDLHLISLVELQRVALIREPGGYRAYSQTYRNRRHEPYSRIEAGTGDLETQVLRAFLSSRIGRARGAFGYDQVDTDGFGGLGNSKRVVTWANLAYPLPGGVWGQLEWRSTTAERESFSDPKRTDWILRLQREFGEGWQAGVVAGHASASDSADSLRKFSASQLALRAARTSRHLRAQLTLRAWDGDGVPTYEPEASVELLAGPASLYASGRYEKWDHSSFASGYAALQLRLPLNARALAEFEDGERGLVGQAPVPSYRFTRWTAGGEITLWTWTLGGRGGRWRVRPSPAVGAPADSAVSLEGGTVGVVEAWARGPLLSLFGGRIELGGSYRNREPGDFYYWPQDSWGGEALYHVLALGGQLEVWVRGLGGTRGVTRVPDPNLGEGWVTVERQYWGRGEAVVRIKDFFLFYYYEYLDAAAGPQDIPGLLLPRARIQFGVKWEFWN